MGLIRLLAVGAAVAVGVNYLTKRRPDGTSMLDDLTSKAPEWMDKAKEFGDKIKGRYAQSGGQQGGQFEPQSQTGGMYNQDPNTF